MQPCEQLFEAARRLGRLVELAQVPARAEAAALANEAEPARKARAGARAALRDACARVERVGWMPWLGERAREAQARASFALELADEEWTSIQARARNASELMASARTARASVELCLERARAGTAPGAGLAPRIDELLIRTRFLADSDGRQASRALVMAPKVFGLAEMGRRICQYWDSGITVQSAPLPSRNLAIAPAPPAAPTRSAPAARTNPASNSAGYGGYTGGTSQSTPRAPAAGRAVRGQMSLDLAGKGTGNGVAPEVVEEPRIWLPVSRSRTREMVERGARVDNERTRGSRLWIPVSERSKLEEFLPLAFRKRATPFAFPPIRHNAAKQNLWSMFDAGSWNHIRTTAYDRAGHRCQLCGKQGGSLWSRIASPEERERGRAVECHEVWEWSVPDPGSGIGIQRLKRLLTICPDCHMAFHSGRTLQQARQAGLEDAAGEYIKTRRMLLNRCDGQALDAQLAQDNAEWEENKSVNSWIIDLGHLASQDFMADHTLVLKSDNMAGVTASSIGGIAFEVDDGTAYAATPAEALAGGGNPQPAGARDNAF